MDPSSQSTARQRFVVLLVLLPVLAAGLGYIVGSERVSSPRGVAQAASPTAREAPSPSTQVIDWTEATERDLIVAPVFMTAHREGVAAALDTLEAIVAREPSVARLGHSLAHQLGRFSISLSGPDPEALEALFTECRPVFRAGCNHGVVEQYLASVPQVDPAALTAFCGALEAPGTPVIDVRECAHGLGHGLLDRLGYDFGPALAACDLFQRSDLREECHDGVFMQNLVRGVGLPARSTAAQEADDHAHHGPGAAGADDGHDGHDGHVTSYAGGAGFRADDLSFPCSAVDPRYAPSCWSYQPSAITRFVRDRGRHGMLTACERAPSVARERCYAGFGKQALSWYRQDEESVIEVCLGAPRPFDGACLGGVVEGWVDEEWGADAAVAFCTRVHWMTSRADACARALGERVSLLHADPADTERACARLETPRYVSACLQGAGRG